MYAMAVMLWRLLRERLLSGSRTQNCVIMNFQTKNGSMNKMEIVQTSYKEVLSESFRVIAG